MADPTEHDNRDDPKSAKLPPVDPKRPTDPRPPATPRPAAKSGAGIPTQGVSPQLKIFVIGLTFLTVMAFGVFAALMIKKIFLKDGTQEVWGPQLLTIAQELQDRGIPQGAIQEYQRYLDTQNVDLKTRSEISLKMASLYLELGQCDQAIAAFLHAKAAQPTSPEVQTFDSKLKTCRSPAPAAE